MTSFGLEGVEEPVRESLIGRIGSLEAEDILPTSGLHLALDVSSTSTGIALWDGISMKTGNIEFDTDKNSLHGEALLRRELRSKLEDILQGMSFDTILVEDVFIGPHIQGVRWLFALNTVIDDMILDESVFCNEFSRVVNTEWKSWLRKTDPARKVRGYNDKEVVNRLLEGLGVLPENGKGSQDRMDAMGIMIGYFARELSGEPIKKRTSGLVKLSEVEALYCPTTEEFEDRLPEGIAREVFKDRVSVRALREAVTANDEVIWVAPKVVSLGTICSKLGVDPIPFGGRFAFWRK